MNKVIKIVLWAVLILVLSVVTLFATLPLWLGPIFRPSVNVAVPQFTKTTFHMGRLSMNPYTGRFVLGDLQVGNPAGYDEPQALTLQDLTVDLDLVSIATGCIHVKDLNLTGVQLAYVKGGEWNVDNFKQIQYNVAGGKEKYEKAKAKADAKKAEQAERDDDVSSLRVVIDRLSISDIRLKYGPLTIPVPPVTLTGIGSQSNGVALVDLGDQIVQAIVQAALDAGNGLKSLGALLGDGAIKAGDKTGQAAEAVGKEAEKAAKILKKLLK